MICPLFCEFFFALIQPNLFGFMFPYTINKNSLSFSSFFVKFVFDCPFYYSLFFKWHLWRLRLQNSCSRCFVVIRDNFLLRVFPEFFRLCFFNQFIGVIFEAGNETRENNWSDFGAEKK